LIPGLVSRTLNVDEWDLRTHNNLVEISKLETFRRSDARIDNSKFKTALGKGKMLSPDVVAEITDHPVGGVCPFGLAQSRPIYLDVSLKAFDEVLPAAGSVNSAVRISVEMLAEVTQGQWVDVCQLQ